MDAYPVARLHILFQYLLAFAADEDAVRVGHVEHLVDFVRGHVARRRSRETHYHGEVAVFVALGRNGQVHGSPVRHVLRRIVGRRRPVRSSIDTEYGEVARVTRPHPVVGIAPELAYRTGRSTDETDVGVLVHDEKEILVPTEKALHEYLLAGILRPVGFGQLAAPFIHLCGILLERQPLQPFGHAVGHLLNLADEVYREAGNGYLLGAVHCPETVGQIVVLGRAELLDTAVTAMVVGEDKPVGRYDFARTTGPEDDDGILERRPVGIVDIGSLQFQSGCLHIGVIRFLEVGQQPHPLIRKGSQPQRQRTERRKEEFFHLRLDFYVCRISIPVPHPHRTPAGRGYKYSGLERVSQSCRGQTGDCTRNPEKPPDGTIRMPPCHKLTPQPKLLTARRLSPAYPTFPQLSII